MAFCAIVRKSASSLALTASRLVQANRNYHSAVFSASSHLNRKPTLGSFVPDFDFSSATETKKCSSNIESLLQLAIDSEIERADYYDHVEEPRGEFTLKIEDSATEHNVVLTREYRGELVEVLGYIECFGPYGKGQTEFCVTISNNSESSLKFDCFSTSDAISIWRIGFINSEISEDDWSLYDGDDVVEFDNMDENMKKAFFEYLEIRGIKPSIVDFMIKCYRYKKVKKMSMELKKIKNFIESCHRDHV
ncbi:hypothetical protein Q3G72_032571 [Acer saccharum]|nr:hypothetical protein Q3G72_032571 [Acer saccharum]